MFHKNCNEGDLRLIEQLHVLRFQAGDDNALEPLVQRYHAPLRYFLRRLLGETQRAEDLLQDVWLTVIRQLHQLRKPEAFSVWLYKIARNNAYREIKKRSKCVELFEDFASEEPVEDDGVFSPDDAATIHVCLERICIQHREVLVLRFLEEMSYENIAAVIGCNPGTVRSRIFYAKRSLRKELEAMNYDR